MDSIDDVVRRAREGDADAFGLVVRRLFRRAVATAFFITGDLHAGEEAAQDAFVTAWRKIRTLRDPAAFRGWFGTILARTASRRRGKRHVSLTADSEPGFTPESEQPGLPEAALRLRTKHREVLALRYVEALSYREISEALGISVARVKSRLHEGRKLLKERLERKGKA